MIRLIAILLVLKNFLRLGILLFNIFYNIIDIIKHIFRRRLRHFQFSLRWNYAIRNIFSRKSILYHIIFFIIAVCVLALCHMNAGAIFDIKYFYYVIGTYAFVYYFALTFMMNWHQLNRQQRREADITRNEENNRFRDRLRRLHPDDRIINSVEDLYDV